MRQYISQIKRYFYFIIHMKILSVVLLLLAYVIGIYAQQNERKLIYIQQIFRHGARYPINPNSKDYSNLPGISKLKGQLTNQGKSQHYLLGRKLYEIYWESLFGKQNNLYRQQKFYFKSTDVHRTIQSLQSHLLGLFENTKKITIAKEQTSFSVPVWNTTIERSQGDLFSKTPYFHPLPAHVQKGEITPWTSGDLIRSSSSSFCPKQKDWQSANYRDPFVIQITQNANFQKAISALSQVLKQNLTFFDVSEYYDNAQCLISLSQKILPIFQENSPYIRDLATINLLQSYMIYYYTQQQLRTTATGFFNETVNHFKRVTKNQDGVQWSIYSAHDSNMLHFLSRLGLANAKCIYDNYLNGTTNSQYCILTYPVFTSQIIFEIYQYPNKTNTFQMRYNGNYRRIPFCGYQLECSVEKFYEWYDSWKDQNWIRNCGVKNSTAETYFSIIIIELGVIIVFAVAAILRYLDKKPKSQDEKKPELAEESNKVPANEVKESLLSEQSEER